MNLRPTLTLTLTPCLTLARNLFYPTLIPILSVTPYPLALTRLLILTLTLTVPSPLGENQLEELIDGCVAVLPEFDASIR